ncbi:hypothetical protein L1887_58483 [Cichorium endivia]|nr:hypothetical protein L1887_58483 [Cichorium endivia]
MLRCAEAAATWTNSCSSRFDRFPADSNCDPVFEVWVKVQLKFGQEMRSRSAWRSHYSLPPPCCSPPIPLSSLLLHLDRRQRCFILLESTAMEPVCTATPTPLLW